VSDNSSYAPQLRYMEVGLFSIKVVPERNAHVTASPPQGEQRLLTAPG
jgi:hypothetical protein